MNVEFCNVCMSREVYFPDNYYGAVPCLTCGNDLFPCSACSDRQAVLDCTWDSEKIGCEQFQHHPDWLHALVSIGGNLKDHWFFVYYTIEGSEVYAKETWMIHNNYVKKIELDGYKYQCILDGLYGYTVL